MLRPLLTQNRARRKITFVLLAAICFSNVCLTINSSGASAARSNNEPPDSHRMAQLQPDVAAAPSSLPNLTPPDAATPEPKLEDLAKLPLSFEANKGQAHERVRYLSRGVGYNVFLTPDEAVLSLAKSEPSQPAKAPHDSKPSQGRRRVKADTELKLSLVGANGRAQIRGLEELPGKSNYFIGNDRRRWQTDVPNYAKVKYEAVYPGIDLVYYGNQQQLEYDFVVAPGADPHLIRVSFHGASKLRLDKSGDVLISTGGGQVRQHKPTVYQEIEGRRKEISSRYLLKGKRDIAFEIGDYDTSRPLIIDPVLNYSSHMHGFPYSMALDSDRNIYLTGSTSSTTFPVINPLQQTYGGGDTDAYVMKLNAAGSAIIYSTYLGGNDHDTGNGGSGIMHIALDPSGNATIFGTTGSADFPTFNALDSTYNGSYHDTFVSKLNAAGNAFVYSTFLGGASAEVAGGIAVDALGNAYLTGQTYSPNFPTLNPIQSPLCNGNNTDIFLTAINSAGTALLFSTHIGGSRSDGGGGIALDSSGNIYLTGSTSSLNFPLVNPTQATKTDFSNDAFVMKVNPLGTALLFSTYLGGNASDYASDIALDSSGNVFVTGTTESDDFPTTAGAFRTAHFGYQDPFVTKIDTVTPSVVYSTYVAGGGSDYSEAIAVDSQGCAIVYGTTVSTNFPLVNPIKSQYFGGYTDLFLSRLNATGSALTFSTFLGGNSNEDARDIVLDSANNTYLTGTTGSTDFPLVNPMLSTQSGGFLMRIGGLVGFNIGGSVRDANGVGLSSVTITLSGSQTGSTQTNASGDFVFVNLPSGGNYTVTPSKTPFSFTPTNRTFNNLSANQTADFTVLAYSLGGRVIKTTGAGEPGVTLTLSGTQSGSVQTDTNGYYSFPAVAAGGNYTVTPSKSDPLLTYTFAPANRSVTNLSANQTLADFTASTSNVVTLNATADAFVQDGTTAANNYGTVTPLQLRTDRRTNNGLNRDVYFKFDLNAVSRSISNVRLRIYAALSEAGSVSTSAYSVASTTWIESGAGGINWNNKPALSAAALPGATATINTTSYAAYEIDVTNYVRSEKQAGRNIVSLALHDPSAVTPNITLNSREAASNKPQLIVTTSNTNNLAPVVSLTSPANGATYTAPASVTVSATASDSDGTISKVDFYAGTDLIGTSTASPYQTTWSNVAAGSYNLVAVATDNSGATTTSGVANVTVNASNAAPVVSLISPLQGTTFAAGSNIPLSAQASDNDGTISKVEFFAGATLVGTATTASAANTYDVTWTNANSGAHSLTAKATDNSNGTTTSGAITVNVVSQTGLSPTADAYVKDGSTATTNFGTALELQSQLSSTAGSNRESYLKFDLTTTTGITKAKVRLYGRLSDATGNNVPVAVYSVASTTWIESGTSSINWNTKPVAATTPLASTTITDNIARWYEWDVTSYVQAEKIAGRSVMSFAVKNTSNSSPYTTFNSREANSNRPQLLLQTTQPRNALLVVGSTTLNTGDNAIKTRLQNLGYTVTAKAAGSTTSTAINTIDADGKALVVISSTVTPANVAAKFRHVAVPVITWEFDLLDDQGMTGTVSGTDFGTTATQTQLAIINATHPMAANLSGTIAAVTAASTFTWGKPNVNASKIATQTTDATKIVIFGYDNGAVMPGLDAPARRVSLFLTDTTAASLSTNGGALFDAAVKWATETITQPTISNLTPTLGPIGVNVNISGLNFGTTQGTSTVTFNGVRATPSAWSDRLITASVPAFATTGPVIVTVSGVASNAVVFAVGATDSDGDGLPDNWELQYFGNLSQNAGGDPDGDGLSNLQEYQQGRNPTKSAINDTGDFVNLKVYTPLWPITP
ncbi:MAG TPA: DNRLRE domain-containing protein [Pyrinomonadaceae bacterium]|jgi:hypothetical protein